MWTKLRRLARLEQEGHVLIGLLILSSIVITLGALGVKEFNKHVYEKALIYQTWRDGSMDIYKSNLRTLLKNKQVREQTFLSSLNPGSECWNIDPTTCPTAPQPLHELRGPDLSLLWSPTNPCVQGLITDCRLRLTALKWQSSCDGCLRPRILMTLKFEYQDYEWTREVEVEIE